MSGGDGSDGDGSVEVFAYLEEVVGDDEGVAAATTRAAGAVQFEVVVSTMCKERPLARTWRASGL